MRSCPKKVSDKVETISNANSKPQSQPDICSAVSSVLDKERRKLNIVVMNLPECTPSADETRELGDLYQFTSVIKNNLKLNIKATKCHRVGKLQEDRPRLLVVTLDNVETKQELLRMSSQFRSIPEWKNLYINPDLTPAEREANWKLRQELARRRAAGEEGIIIRQGAIVKLANATRVRSQSRGHQTVDESGRRSQTTDN